MSNQELTQEDKDFCTYAYIAEACKVVSCILDMDSEKELADKRHFAQPHPSLWKYRPPDWRSAPLPYTALLPGSTIDQPNLPHCRTLNPAR